MFLQFNLVPLPVMCQRWTFKAATATTYQITFKISSTRDVDILCNLFLRPLQRMSSPAFQSRCFTVESENDSIVCRDRHFEIRRHGGDKTGMALLSFDCWSPDSLLQSPRVVSLGCYTLAVPIKTCLNTAESISQARFGSITS
jgi:hypothetical protein